MNGYLFAFLLILLITLAGLVYLAFSGFLLAGVILAIMATVILIACGSGIALAVMHQANKKQERDFRANMQENLGLMSALQTIQNKQNSLLLNQVRQLPTSEKPNGNILIEDGIFDDLQ